MLILSNDDEVVLFHDDENIFLVVEAIIKELEHILQRDKSQFYYRCWRM